MRQNFQWNDRSVNLWTSFLPSLNEFINMSSTICGKLTDKSEKDGCVVPIFCIIRLNLLKKLNWWFEKRTVMHVIKWCKIDSFTYHFLN